MKFHKPAPSLESQLDQLRNRGLRIVDIDAALHALAHFNYYRLRGYWIALEAQTGDGSHRFREGASIEHVLRLYNFDEQLRALVSEAVAAIEVSVRTRFAYHLACRHGPHAFLDQSLFDDPVKHADCLSKLHDEVGRSNEVFVKHYLQSYSEPPLPPVWAICEVMSLGSLSKWYGNLVHRADRKCIADAYDMDETVLVSFLHHLTTVRNHCAHHGRLWNRRFTVTMRVPRHRPVRALRAFQQSEPQTRRVHNALVMMGHFMEIIHPERRWLGKVRLLIEESGAVDPQDMGFPEDWKKRPMWREAK